MNKAIIGKKLGMSQVFAADGTVIPVTVVEAGPCPVVQVKTAEKDGYSSVQLGFEKAKNSLSTKSVIGHCKKAGVPTVKTLKEFRLDNAESYTAGKEIKCDIFAEGDMVVALGSSDWRVKANKREFGGDFAHVFKIRDGKIVEFNEYMDTAACSNAHQKAMSA
jgi:large subunit ribosomal protein L3